MESINEMFPDKYFDKSELNLWTCLRPTTPDDMPMIGPTGSYPNLYMNTGHGGRGSALAMGSSKLLSEIMLREIPSLNPEDFSPKRFGI